MASSFKRAGPLRASLLAAHEPICATHAGDAPLATAAIRRYEFGMKNVAKVAVSIPLQTLRALERARVRLRKTRSAAVTEAIEQWLNAEEVSEADRLYVEGYLRQPEQNADVAAVAAAVAATWERWDEEG